MKKVLVIDDEEDLTFFVKANLELSGDYEVVVANSGKEGIHAAIRNNPDVILLDIMMPCMDGFEVLGKLKKNKKTANISVIMLTAKGDEDSRIKSVDLQSAGFIIKPVQVDFLKSSIEEALKR